MRQSFWIPELSLWTVPRTFFELVASPPPGLWREYRYEGIPVLGFFVVLLSGAWSKGGWKIRYLILQSLFPMLAIGCVSFWVPLWEARYFRFAHVTLLICLAAGAWSLVRAATARAIVATGCLVLSLAGSVFFWSLRDVPNRQSVRGACLVIQQEDPGDGLPVIVDSPINFVVARYYANDLAWPSDRVKLWTGSKNRPAEAVHLVSADDWWNPLTQTQAGSPQSEVEGKPKSLQIWLISEPESWARSGMNFGPVQKFDSDLWISDWSVEVRRLSTSDVLSKMFSSRHGI